MPLPLLLGIGAAIAGIAGVSSGVNGAKKLKEANDTMKSAEERNEGNKRRFERQSRRTTADMDLLGKTEEEILASFKRFSDIFEKIHNRPEFAGYSRDGVAIPKYNAEEIKRVSVGAGVLVGGLGGAAAGTAGGFAAAGATTAAVMALGTASTGTAIASLSGAAATNATLAALGGGALAAGGGGMALGSAILGGATLGVGLLVGGIIFNATGSKLSDKADEAWSQMMRAEREIDRICEYLTELSATSERYLRSLQTVNDVYKEHLDKLHSIVEIEGKTNWYFFSDDEQQITENTSLLVGLLYQMCKVKLVLVSENKNDLNRVNTQDVNASITNAEEFLHKKSLRYHGF